MSENFANASTSDLIQDADGNYRTRSEIVAETRELIVKVRTTNTLKKMIVEQILQAPIITPEQRDKANQIIATADFYLGLADVAEEVNKLIESGGN